MANTMTNAFPGKTVMLMAVAFATMFCECPLQAASAETIWKGSHGVQEWSDEGNWTDGVPIGDMTARFTFNQSHSTIALVPPLSYTGLIVTTNAVLQNGWDNVMPTILTLTVLDGATWRVGGSGVVVATPGIAAHIDADFVGVIDVRADQSFTVPDSLDAAVQFIGTGTLVLDSASRLGNVSGFSGRLVMPDGAAVSPTDVVQAQQRRLELGDGGSLVFSEPVLAYGGTKPITDWTQEGWQRNGKLTIDPAATSLDLEDGPPQVNEAGDLELVTGGAQMRTAWYTGRKFKLTDAWSVNFIWTPSLPADSQYVKAGFKQSWCGVFGVYLQSSGPDNLGPHWRVPAASAFGLTLYNYRDGSQSLKWNLGSNESNYGYGSALAEKNLGGVTFDRAVDFTVTCVEGLLTVTLRQGDKSVSLQKDFARDYLRYRGDGVYLGFGGASNYWDEKTVPWHRQVLSGFSGWYRSLDACAWTEEAGSSNLFPFKAENCYAYKYNNNDGFKTEVDASALFLSDGAFQLQPNESGMFVTCGNTTPFPVSKRHLMSIDVDWGAGGDAGGFGFAFAKFKPQNHWVYQWDSNNTYEKFPMSEWGNAIGFYTRNYQKQYCSYYAIRGGGTSTPLQDDEFLTRSVKNSHARDYVVYDPAGTFRRESAQHPQDGGSGKVFATQWTVPEASMSAYQTTTSGGATKDSFYLAFRAGAGWGQMPTTITGLKMFEMTDNTSPTLSGAVAVRGGATATLELNATYPDSSTPVATVGTVELGDGAKLAVSGGGKSAVVLVGRAVAGKSSVLSSATGVKVAVGTVEFVSGEGPGTGLKLEGNVELADGLTVVVPTDWKSRFREELCLLDCGSSAVPSSIRIFNAEGRDLADKAEFAIRNGKVFVTLGKGMVLLFR